MTYRPTISVIIPVYNGERFLAEAIQSVLDQTLPPDEIIVVDDGSTDGTAAVASQYAGVLVLTQPNRGVGAALNLAISHACGDLLAFLDADDRWQPDKLERQVNALIVDPGLDMVFGHVRQFYDDEITDRKVVEARNIKALQQGISRCAMLIRRQSFARIGAFPEDPGVPEFLEWYGRAQAAGLRFTVLPDIVFERRIHAYNSAGGRSPEALRQSYLLTLRQSIARRRSADTPAS